MIRALLVASWRSNWWLLAVFSGIGLLYLLLILGMYDEGNMQFIKASVEGLPEGLSAAVGMDTIPTSLVDFAANYYYGFLIQLFLSIHLAILPIRLVVSYVDRGAMAYLLATPNTRSSIITTQAAYMLLHITALVAIMTLIGAAFCALVHPGLLDVGAFVALNLMTLLLAYALGGLVFLCSAIFSESRMAIAAGAAILLGFFIVAVVARIGHGEGFYGIVERLTIYHLVKPRAIVAGETNLLLNGGLLLLIAGASIGGAVRAFRGKDLAL